MAQLTTTDMALVYSIFGMYSGWVLDFSNDRFAASFNRDLQIDIYNAPAIIRQFHQPPTLG